MRRLPVYLLLDVSGSMSGEPIEAVKNGMQTLHSALRKDPYALESAYISVITFASDVQQVVPLTEVAQFVPPEISASGGTSIGGVLAKVAECAEREVVKSTPTQKSDWKPLVFIMTDGYPTDDVNPGLAKFKQYKWGTVVACAAGDNCDLELLKLIAVDKSGEGSNVVQLSTADQSSISAFFKWVSASVSVSSKRIDAGGDSSSSIDELPPPPPEITLV